jgi:hypothetical protein
MVPFADNLDVPSVMDLETLFGTEVLSGRQHMLRRFRRYELVTTSLRRFMENLSSRRAAFSQTCFITHASRNDIILGLLSHAAENAESDPPFEGGLLLTGKRFYMKSVCGVYIALMHMIAIVDTLRCSSNVASCYVQLMCMSMCWSS